MTRLLTIVALFLVQSVIGFLPLSTKRTSSIPRSLHPEQAAELEACAYDLMRDYNSMHSATAAGQYEFHHQPQQQAILAAGGPIAWCRRWIGGRKTEDHSPAMETMTPRNQDATFWGKQP